MEHQQPVILITSSEDGGTDDKRDGDAACLRSEEYKILADLTGFDNLRAMLETERAHTRSKKRKRKTKKKKTTCYGAQGEVTEKELADEVFAPESNKVFRVREEEIADEVFAPESNMVSGNIGASPNITVDAGREKEQVDGVEVVETTEAFKGYGVVKPSTVIDLCSSSTEDDQIEGNVGCCRAAKEPVPVDTVVLKRRKRRRRKKGKMNEVHEAGNILIPLLQSQKKKDKSGGAVMSFRTDPVGSVLQKLLRGPRYFDPPSSSPDECLRCGEVHVTRKCTTTYRKKPCSLCAGYGHSWKRCPQGLDCFSCKKRGHRTNRCPEKKKQGGQQFSEICLRCGESGHHMMSCRANYSPDDLKEIQCYVCKSFGHLCCVEFKDPDPGCISCYNCGHSGHLGSDCTVAHGNAKVVTCSKPQEEGHSTSGVTICSKRMEEDKSASRVTTCSKHKAEHSGSRWADSLLNTNAFALAHIASACSSSITPADSLLPEQRFGDSSTFARETVICEGSNSMPKNLEEHQRKNQFAISSKRKEEVHFASRVATCSMGKEEGHFGGRCVDYLHNRNSFTLAASVFSPTITPADTFVTCSKGNRNAFTLAAGVCSPTITPANTFATCSKGNRNAFMLAASVCSPTITPADTFATCSKGNRNAFTLAASICSPTVTPAGTFATCSKGKEEGHFAGRWVDYLHNKNALTLAASVCSSAITPTNTLQPEHKLGDSSATIITID